MGLRGLGEYLRSCILRTCKFSLGVLTALGELSSCVLRKGGLVGHACLLDDFVLRELASVEPDQSVSQSVSHSSSTKKYTPSFPRPHQHVQKDHQNSLSRLVRVSTKANKK
jgi:hypothetical protein